MSITPKSRINFGNRGRYGSYGKRVCNLTDRMLHWIVDHADTDPMAQYAEAAREVLAGRAAGRREFGVEDDLEAQADALLRNAGCGKLARRMGRR
jgi:hypothetical protein